MIRSSSYFVLALLPGLLALGACNTSGPAPVPLVPVPTATPIEHIHPDPDLPMEIDRNLIVEHGSPGVRHMVDQTNKTDAQWREALTPEQYRIMREKGTEPPFTGQYWSSKTPGVYRCAACGQPLFDSEQKYNSGTGWPSFWRPQTEQAVASTSDHSLGMRRTEVHCSRCGSHLGHVFEDGPAPTGLRYCINSASLTLAEREKTEK